MGRDQRRHPHPRKTAPQCPLAHQPWPAPARHRPLAPSHRPSRKHSSRSTSRNHPRFRLAAHQLLDHPDRTRNHRTTQPPLRRPLRQRNHPEDANGGRSKARGLPSGARSPTPADPGPRRPPPRRPQRAGTASRLVRSRHRRHLRPDRRQHRTDHLPKPLQWIDRQRPPEGHGRPPSHPTPQCPVAPKTRPNARSPQPLRSGPAGPDQCRLAFRATRSLARTRRRLERQPNADRMVRPPSATL